jgi:manganese/zinc/iron transport system ATP- binding protein
MLRSAVGETEPASIKISGLTVAYDGRPALEDISFSIPAGTIVGLIGPNGAGKTTLLRAVLGMVKPAAGTVTVPGRVGYMPQLGVAAWAFPLDVTDVALQGSYRRAGWLRRPSKAERATAQAALADVGMLDHAHRQIGELSGGQRQRVLLARALVQQGDLLLLDEPLSGADAATEASFVERLRRLRDDGRTVLVSSHDLGWASVHCDLVCLLSRRLIAFGPPAETLTAARLAEAYGSQILDVGGIRVLAPEGHRSH